MKFNKVALSIACAAGFTVAGAAAANADTVTVKSGDTLSQIADENNTTVSSIQSLNSLQNIHLIFPGQKLVINANNGDAAVSTQQSAQTVQQASQQQTTQQASQQQTVQQSTQTMQQASQQQTMADNTASSCFIKRTGCARLDRFTRIRRFIYCSKRQLLWQVSAFKRILGRRLFC